MAGELGLMDDQFCMHGLERGMQARVNLRMQGVHLADQCSLVQK